MGKRLLILALIFMLLFESVAFAIDDERKDYILSSMSVGIVLGAMLGGAVNQLFYMNNQRDNVLAGAAIGAGVGVTLGYFGKKSWLLVENDKMRFSLPPIYIEKQGPDMSVKTTLITLKY